MGEFRFLEDFDWVSDIVWSDGLIEASKKDTIGWIDTSGKFVKISPYFIDRYAKDELGIVFDTISNKYGYFNVTKDIVIPPKFDYAYFSIKSKSML